MRNNTERNGRRVVAGAAVACLALVPLAAGAGFKAGPQATITGGPSGTVASSSATFTFTSDDPSATFACGLDSGPWVDCGSPQGYSGLADGPHSFRVRAIDSGGKHGPPDERGWTVQVAPPPPAPPPPPPAAPETQITSGPPSSTTSTSATISFAASEAGSSFDCSLDGSAFQACASPATYGGLGVGSHSFAVRAVSSGGTTDPTPATWAWIVTALPIDTTPPDTTIVGGPNGTVATPSAAFSFSASEPATFACSLDGAPFATCTSPVAYAALAAGSHMFAVRASDPAGNVDPTPATRSWVVAPDAPVSSAPPAAAAPSTIPPVGSPATLDVTPPGEVQAVMATPGNRLITLRWRAPDDTDFARVVVARSEEGSTDTVDVYRGDAGAFVDRRVRNGTAYRYLLVTYDRAGNRSDGVRANAMPRASALELPAPGARVTAPPRLVWTPRRGANYYNVQLFRGPHKVLSAWPRRARLQLTSAWRYGGRTYRLTPGDYRWYVWPGVGLRSKARYGPLLGDSRFVVEQRPAVRAPESG